MQRDSQRIFVFHIRIFEKIEIALSETVDTYLKESKVNLVTNILSAVTAVLKFIPNSGKHVPHHCYSSNNDPIF